MSERDVLILGAGPAGLSAARELKRLGIGKVTILEREQTGGGIPRHCGHRAFGLQPYGFPLTGPDFAKRLVDDVSGLDLRLGWSALALESGGVVRVAGPRGAQTMQARHVLLALGAREEPRSARLVSGTRPAGIMNTGTLQQLVYLGGKVPFARPLIVGSELVSFSALLTLRHAGIGPVAMIEENARVVARRPADWAARLLFNVPVLVGTRLKRILGQERVTGVEIEQEGRIRHIECDGLILTGRFRPENALLTEGPVAMDRGSRGPAIDQFWRCSDSAYFAAGNLLRGIETAGQCWREGRAAARAIAASLDHRLPLPNPEIRVAIGGAISYVYPQRLHPIASMDDPLLFKARVSRAVSGNLRVLADGREIWSRRISALPERRIAWRVPAGSLSNCATVAVTLEPAP